MLRFTATIPVVLVCCRIATADTLPPDARRFVGYGQGETMNWITDQTHQVGFGARELADFVVDVWVSELESSIWFSSVAVSTGGLTRNLSAQTLPRSFSESVHMRGHFGVDPVTWMATSDHWLPLTPVNGFRYQSPEVPLRVEESVPLTGSVMMERGSQVNVSFQTTAQYTGEGAGFGAVRINPERWDDQLGLSGLHLDFEYRTADFSLPLTVDGIPLEFDVVGFSFSWWDDSVGQRYNLEDTLWLDRHPWQPGDATKDGDFDQNDIVSVLRQDRYLHNEWATWQEGDFTFDGRFNQYDLVAALQAGHYLEGSSVAAQVPEPEAWWLLLLGVCAVMAFCCWQKSRSGNPMP